MSDRDRPAPVCSQGHARPAAASPPSDRTTKDAPFQGRLQIKGDEGMVLRGLLSNRELATLLHSLTVALEDQAQKPSGREP
jgi:hypothetical protein